jgi:uncharacterized iron-regulated protein
MTTTRALCLLLLAASVPLLGGCVRTRGCRPRPCLVVARAPVPTPEPPAEPEPAPPPTSALYHGATGEPAELGPVLASWRDADVIVFGELHGHPVGAEMQMTILETMAAQGHPVALAMEFFERDTQATLDAYLAGDLDEETFVKEARQNKAYPKTHRPLVEFCKTMGFPVVAANAPRKLVSAYRKTEDDYDTFREGLSEEEQASLPRETSVIEDDYHARFMKLMGPKRGPSFFRSQSLWDDAMAEAVADFRDEHPDTRVLFIVGGFHIQNGLGTITKYKLRRPGDGIRTVVMSMDSEAHLPFDEEETGSGDLVVNVPAPKRKKPMGPNPHERPKKMPETHPPAKPKAGGTS